MRQRQQHKLQSERSKKSRIKEKVLFERGAHEKRYFINFFHSPLAAKIPIKHSASCATFHMLLFFPECFCISRVCAHRGEIRSYILSISFTLTAFSSSVCRRAKRSNFFFLLSSSLPWWRKIIELYSFLASQYPWNSLFPRSNFPPFFPSKHTANMYYSTTLSTVGISLSQLLVLFILTNADVAPGRREGSSRWDANRYKKT